MDRKAEIERKKAKLALMKEERKRKEDEKKKRETDAPGSLSESSSQGDLKEDADTLLKKLGIPDAAKTSPPAAAVAQVKTSAAVSLESIAQPQVLSRKNVVNLTASKVSQLSIPPRENVSYSKETQTVLEVFDKEDLSGPSALTRTGSSTASTTPSMGNSPRHYPPFGSPGSRFRLANLEWDDEFALSEKRSSTSFPVAFTHLLGDGIQHTVSLDEDTDSMEAGLDTPPPTKMAGGGGGQHRPMPHVELAKPVETVEDIVKEEEKAVIKEFTEEEKEKIMNSEDFMRAFYNTTTIMERALYEGDRFDILKNYTRGEEGEKEGLLAEGERLKLNRQFFDERWSKHRVVTSMDWSTTYPELLVASYNSNEESPLDPDGVALIWNLKYKKPTPEYIFHCQSAVVSTCFAKFHPNLIVGGTYSGQIVLWDNRTNKRTPVQRTPLSAAAHTHPVYCVQVVGTQNAHNLISISTDGKICSWSLDMLASPQDSMELQHKQTKAVAVTSMGFFSNDVNNYVVGTEEGVVYTSCRHGSKAGIVDNFEGHLGPVTGIHSNNVPGQIDFSPYFLSSSFDWTVKLWNAKDPRPLHSFEDNSEYIFDVKWSPIHPALFATVDGMGRLDIWNCNNDIEVPSATTYVENAALNKCLWHQTGHHIAVGDDLGKVHIYDIGESLANPKPDEWTKFLQTLTEMKQNQEEREDDRHVSFMKPPLR